MMAMARICSASVFLVVIASVHAQSQCKSPVVEKRLMADDVRFASPFYVIALPKSAETAKVDNVCYTYFETGTDSFHHVMSVTYRDGSNKYHTYTKADIADQKGLAEGKAADGSSCTYHDYTLVPICNSTVFILYRCFIEGECGNIDMKPDPKTDSRVVLAATPVVSQECYKEVDKSLKDTSFFKGGDYVILPQGLTPQCVTKYNNTYSIGNKRAVGSKEVSGDNSIQDRFDDSGDSKMKTTATQKSPSQNPKPTQATWSNAPGKNPANNQGANKTQYKQTGSSFQSSVSGSGFSGSYAFSHASSGNGNGYVPPQGWEQNQWTMGPNPWMQPGHPGETHYHTWQAHNHGQQQQQPAHKLGQQQQQPPARLSAKPDPWKNSNNNNNVYYHVHTWENPPPGCCKCINQ